MPARKETAFSIGRDELLLSAGEIKALDEVIKRLPKVNSLLQARSEIMGKISKLQVKQAFSGKEETANYQKRLETLKKIYNQIDEMNKEKFRRIQESVIPRYEPIGSETIDWMKTGGRGGKASYEIDEMIRGTHRQGTAQDELKKKSAWQLVYWGAIGSAWKQMTDNSKVLDHYITVIGAGFGFILDMILLNLMPIVVPFVKALFQIGGWFTTLPGWVKTATALLVGFGIVLLGIVGTGVGLASVAGAITGIGTAASIAAGSKGVGGLLAGLQAVGALGTIAILFKYGVIGAAIAAGVGFLMPGATGLEQREKNGIVETRIGAYGQGAEEGWSPGGAGGINFAPGQSGSQTNTTVIIDGKAIDESMYRSISTAALVQGLPRST